MVRSSSLCSGVFSALSIVYSFSLGLAAPASGQSVSYVLKETLPIESTGYNQLAGVSDLDGDGALEAVIWQVGGTDFRIVERTATGWFEELTITENPTRTVAFGDVDGDGIDEFLSGNATTATIREATANDTYSVTGTFALGTTLEQPTRIGDSDGDGLLEFLVPRETVPATVHILEGAADDTYTNIGSVTGTQQNCAMAGVDDIDGDMINEIVFQDSPVAAGAFATHIYEGGSLVMSIPNFAAYAVGDTDNNGLVEIIGRTQPGSVNDTRIFESDADNSYVEVWSDSMPYRVADLDGDGIADLHAVTMSAGGDNNVITIYERSGSSAAEVWDSGMMFLGSADSISTILGIGDTDGNGQPEVAVLQGLELHIIEKDLPQPPAGLPAAGVWGLFALAGACIAGAGFQMRRG